MKNKKLILFTFILINFIISFSNVTYAYNSKSKKVPDNTKNIITYKQLQASVNDINKKANLANPDDSLALEDKKVHKVEKLTKDIEKFLNTKASINLNKKQLDNLQLSISKTINQKINGQKINMRIVTFGYYGMLFGFYNKWCYVQWWNKDFVSSKLIEEQCPAGIQDFFAVKLKDKIGFITMGLDTTEYSLPHHPVIINSYILKNNKILYQSLFNIKSIKGIKGNNKYWSYVFEKNYIMFKLINVNTEFNINKDRNGFDLKCKNKLWKLEFFNGLLVCYPN